VRNHSLGVVNDTDAAAHASSWNSPLLGKYCHRSPNAATARATAIARSQYDQSLVGPAASRSGAATCPIIRTQSLPIARYVGGPRVASSPDQVAGNGVAPTDVAMRPI